MKYCKHCHLSYRTKLNRCLFCHELLSDTDDLASTDDYPTLKEQKHSHRFPKIIGFLLTCGCIICLIINLTLTKKISWSLIPVISCLYGLYTLITFTKKQTALEQIIRFCYGTLAFVVLLGYTVSNSTWSMDFVFPLGLITMNLVLVVIYLCKKNALFDLSIYPIMTSLLSLIPLLLTNCSILTYTWPSYICGLLGILVLFGFFFFSGKETREELKRRFHL